MPLSCPFLYILESPTLIELRGNRQGAQGILDGASQAHLENEFGTKNEDEVFKKILIGGSPQTSTVSYPLQLSRIQWDSVLIFIQAPERQGDTNITAGPSVAH